MTAPRHDSLDEREVDLGRWRRAVVTLWWIPVVGLVLGAIIGALYSLRGTSTFKAAVADLARAARLAGRRRDRELRHEPARGLADRQLGVGQAQAEREAGHALRRAARPRVGRAGRDGDRGRCGACDAADLADGAGSERGEDAGCGQRARASRRRADDRAVRRHEDPDVPAGARDDEHAALVDQRASRRAQQGRREVEPRAARPARADQPDRQRRAAAGESLRPEGDDAAAARVREERREREGDHGSRARRSRRRTRRRRR